MFRSNKKAGNRIASRPRRFPNAIWTPLAETSSSAYMDPVISRALLILALFLVVEADAQRPSSTGAGEKKPAANAEPDFSALGAINLLPKDAAARVARIEGPDGRPFPERWYVLVHDPATPRGLREYVIGGGKVIANRALSQFADSVLADEVVGSAPLKMNNDEAAGIAAQFARYNNQQLGGVRYEYFKSIDPPAPVWRLTSTDAKGKTLGTIVLHATKGTLLSFQGFEKSPMTPAPESATGVPTVQASEPSPKPAKKSASQTASRSERSNPAPVAVRAVPVRREPVRQGPADKVGGFFRKIFRD
jgi:hypothetical protein